MGVGTDSAGDVQHKLSAMVRLQATIFCMLFLKEIPFFAVATPSRPLSDARLKRVVQRSQREGLVEGKNCLERGGVEKAEQGRRDAQTTGEAIRNYQSLSVSPDNKGLQKTTPGELFCKSERSPNSSWQEDVSEELRVKDLAFAKSFP